MTTASASRRGFCKETTRNGTHEGTEFEILSVPLETTYDGNTDLFRRMCLLEGLFQGLHPKEVDLFCKLTGKNFNIIDPQLKGASQTCPPYFNGAFLDYFIQLYDELKKDPDYIKDMDELSDYESDNNNDSIQFRRI